MNNLNTYLIFNGNCRQALEFYRKCLGGVLYLSTYAEMPGACDVPGFPTKAKDWIIHARLTIKTLVLMASDTRPDMLVTPGDNFLFPSNAKILKKQRNFLTRSAKKGLSKCRCRKRLGPSVSPC